MDESPTKRRGPILWLAGKSRRWWIIVALTPTLYVASFFLGAWLLDSSRTKWHEEAFWIIYAPMEWLLIALLGDMF